MCKRSVPYMSILVMYRPVYKKKEGFPTTIRHIVSANELDLVKLALVDFGDANFARAHITAFGAQVLHALQSQFKQIAMLNTR
ncbi:hypothetical protein DFQ28_004174, partial [Apophysomyces sp. BC1034]